MTYSSQPAQIPFLAGNYPTEEDRNTKGGYPIVIKKEPSIQHLVNVVANYVDNVAPEQYQRPLSWSKDEKKAFLESLFMDRVEGVIVLVNIIKALHRMLKIAPDDRAIEHIFKPLKESEYKYIILDGNNRLQFMINLLNDTYDIPEGEYGYIRDPQDTSVSTFKVKRNKNKYSDLPQAVRETIETRNVIISEYSQIGYDGLSDVFLNTNSGVFPNAQEIRNAFNSPWADYVRALRYEVPELLGYMFKNFKKRYCGDEWIVDCLAFVLSAVDEDEDDVTFSPISQSSKNTLYRSTFLTSKEQEGYLEVFKNLSDYIGQMIDAADSKEDKAKLKRKVLLQNLFWMMSQSNGIVTYDQATEAVRLHEVAYGNKDRFFGEKGEEYDDLTFKNACEGTRAVNIEYRYEILSEIIQEVTSNVYSDEANPLERL